MKIYYGDETKKAVSNFPITGVTVDIGLIKALALVKQAAADVNNQKGRLSAKTYKAISKALGEVIQGKFDDQFVTDSIQGGAGTSINMNVNEVVAKRAEEILGKGSVVHYLDHVNMSQSTNDVVPTALKLTSLRLLDEYLTVLKTLEKSFLDKSRQFIKIVKVGRTHLQDAVPITLGQEFGAYYSFVRRDKGRLSELKKYLLETNLGGTAIGTGVNTPRGFSELVNMRLSSLSGYKFKPAANLIDATQNVDTFLQVTCLLKISAIGISKICNDLRLMASGPRTGFSEIKLPELQKGSTIMPGKNNPVALEAMNQISFQVVGNSNAAAYAALNGQLELNAMMPIFIKAIIESFTILTNGVSKLVETVNETEVNEDECKRLFENSLSAATLLASHIGYDKAADLTKKALKNNTSLLEEVRNDGVLTEKEIKKIFTAENLTNNVT
jgi:aspartate ammonia-lyase